VTFAYRTRYWAVLVAWAAPRFSDCGICGFYAAICEFMYSVRTSCGVR